MKSTLLRIVAVGILLLGCCSAAEQSFGDLLNLADGVRTANTVEFNQLLKRLDQSVDRATPTERMQLRLLHAYQPLLAGDYQASIAQLKAIIASNPAVDLRYRAGAMLANNYALARQFADGLEIMQRTLLLSGEVKDPNTRQQGLIVAAVLYNQVGQYRLGLRYADQVLSHPLTARNRCIAGGMRVESLLHLDAPPDDESVIAAIGQCQALNEQIPAGLVISYLAKKWFDEDKLDAAAEILKKNVTSIEATHFPRGIGEIRSLLSQILLSKGDIEGAERNADAALAQKSGIANTPPLAAAYKVLYQIAEQRHDLAGALAYYKQYAEADKGYLNEVKTRELAYQIVRNENQQKNQQISLLNRQNSLLQLQQQVDQKTAQNSRLLMLLAVLSALTIAYWGYKTRRLQASLRRMAETDALTGICNRHHFTVKSDRTLAQCARGGEHVALIMFDLDHFKSINDSYGHATGDWVLTCVAATCAGMCRKIDHLGRLGGEEFAILLHGCDLKAATRVAEDCRVHMSRIDTSASGYTFPITASFGVSATSMSGYDLDKLMSHADQMLYRAKHEGRNRVRAYAPDQPIEMREHAATEHPAPEHAAPEQAAAEHAERRGEADFPDAPSLDTASA